MMMGELIMNHGWLKGTTHVNPTHSFDQVFQVLHSQPPLGPGKGRVCRILSGAPQTGWVACWVAPLPTK